MNEDWVEGKLLPKDHEKTIEIITNFFNKHGYVAIDFYKHWYPFLTTIAHVMKKGGAIFSRDENYLVWIDVDPVEKTVLLNAVKYTPELFRRVIKAYLYQEFE